MTIDECKEQLLNGTLTVVTTENDYETLQRVMEDCFDNYYNLSEQEKQALDRACLITGDYEDIYYPIILD